MLVKDNKSNQNSWSKFAQILFILAICAIGISGINATQENDKNWAQTKLASMTLKEKIGQLFMVAAFSNKGEAHKKEISNLVSNYHIGGLIFFQGGPIRQAELNNYYQSLAKVPLFMAMDAEWGLAMRLDSTVKYPRQMTLGAIKDKHLIYTMGQQIAIQSQRIGMHINFAPVVDVNVNPMNPVIGTRSFGENKYEVTERAYQYMKGMQDQFVLANAKHFPGHGDTDVDSHLGLPVIKHDMKRLSDVELYPFKELFKKDLKSVMVAHIHIPAIDSTPNIATTLSQNAVAKLLKEEMGFKGLAFTDALNMKGVAKYHEPGQTDLLALKAGNDVLLYPMDVPKAIEVIEKAIINNEITEMDLDAHVLKILEMKSWAKVETYAHVDTTNLVHDLNKEEYEALNYKLRASALTVLKLNTSFPISLEPEKKILNITIGKETNEFSNTLSKYTALDNLQLDVNELTDSKINELIEKAKQYDQAVLSITCLNNQTRRAFGVTAGLKKLIERMGAQDQVITLHYGNPYSLKDFESCTNLVCGYDFHPYAQQAMAQALVGAQAIDGQLPVSSGVFRQGDGIFVDSKGVLGFDFPSNNGLDAKTLNKIDSIVHVAIESKATPGCQVLVAKRGNIIYDKSFGHTDYSEKNAVTHQTIYDLASVTKVLGTGMALMKLTDEGKIDINKKLKDYLPELDTTNKGDMIIKNILAHQSGLKPYIPYWAKTMEGRNKNPEFYNTTKSDKYSIQVAQNMYVIPSIKDSIYKWSNETELLEKEDGSYPYKYSDIGYYYMQRIIEKISGQPLDEFLTTQVYNNISLPSLTFNPLNKHDIKTIAPTEDDSYFRKQLIHGFVHDQGAALMGGVAGHAGLFSNSFDVAQILQMTLNNGHYNNCKLIDGQIICDFTAKQMEGANRKGATWDRMRPEGKGPSSDYASELSYGHNGFTGTLIWVDPTYDLVYVFLSNRVNPDASNPILGKTDVRTKIQDVIYESILNYNEQHDIYSK